LNYIVFDRSYAMINAGAVRVPEGVGFDPGLEITVAPQLTQFQNAITTHQAGYIYVWVSNESENSNVWFDDLKVTHRSSRVTQATDYYAWGNVMRENKSPEDVRYRHGYQGQYAEKDDETGWNHFELREYDPVIGRWTGTDPYGQYWSPYVGMGNNPVSGVDPDGGKKVYYNEDGTWLKTTHNNWWHNLWNGIDHYVPDGEGGHKFITKNEFWDNFVEGIGPWTLPSRPGLNVDLAVTTLDKNAKSKPIGYCAKYVRLALEGGGMNTDGRPGSAKDYDKFLTKKGFYRVSSTNYEPIKGDIVVMKSFTYDGKSHPHGHIQMYNGTQWVSDFKQKDFWPGSGYRSYKPDYKIFRWHHMKPPL
jgi:RHS repeat-associated protein